MSFNTFGHLFRVTTWGESHGPALGATVDGCPPGIALDESLIQPFLDRRRPGLNAMTTQRQEPDRVRILSGVYEGRTTGTPIQLMIENTDQRSRDYSEIARTFRPGHADLAYHLKYGLRDPRGGGRSSARETAARVAAGGVARAALSALLPDLEILGYMVQMGAKTIDRSRFDADEIARNDFFVPDAGVVAEWTEYLRRLRSDAHDSVGAVVEVVARGVPAGLGAPIYAKLDTDLAAAMMSINAVKGVEIGAGMAAAELTGTQNADEIRMGETGPEFLSNHAGGILGGISTGQEVVVRFAVKPTSSILTPRRSIDIEGNPVDVVTKGRHDPCVGIRAVPVAEAMMACVLLDHLLLDRGQTGGQRGRIGPQG
ncbi:chorismate synthase [Phaeovulum vinaykumarii]|uniref:Chorismate synthase n=1 Tax=Phaeovulum vinaykumarii TaxID=407234 RepID=A0A1N7KRH7_9RHOB|nr:chorismate synthase [Phaeovulum vinaykumarii]SIS64213.1 chorismate synthase [Phaeovulum vinaykumarii]SOC01645.1 chorismate synthase [Phaeovulum vinaykumarii]